MRRRAPLYLPWFDRMLQLFAPGVALKRVRARITADIIARHYEAAAAGRRTRGWVKPSGDANAAVSAGLAPLRNVARDLVRNNPYAKSAVKTICDQTVGWGIVATPAKSAPARARTQELWKTWAETKACDADGRQDLAGLQKLVLRTVVEAGETLVRRRWRRMEDGLPIPMQLQVLEPDFLDTAKDGMVLPNGGRIVQGIEFDPIGRRAAYWLFREHPGSMMAGAPYGASDRIPASEILHVFDPERAGQARGVSWFGPVILRMRDFDEYEDAALMKQKIAACLAALTTDVDGTTPTVGAADPEKPELDLLEPGMILNLPAGRNVEIVQPPTVSEHAPYSETVLRAIATGLGVTYEDLTGDYSEMPFSAARMSRLRHQARVEDWRWRMMIPQFCDPVWWWFMQAATGFAGVAQPAPAVWTAPPMPMIEPDKEGLAYQRNIRAGIISLSEAIRERGYDPDDLLEEYRDDLRKLDAFGIILDSDARQTSAAGLTQARPAGTLPPKPGAFQDPNAKPTGAKDPEGDAAVAGAIGKSSANGVVHA